MPPQDSYVFIAFNGKKSSNKDQSGSTLLLFEHIPDFEEESSDSSVSKYLI
jgi:hypothetical protein